MKVWITGEGKLMICGQNGLEEYALRKWVAENTCTGEDRFAGGVFMEISGKEPVENMVDSDDTPCMFASSIGGTR